MKTAKIFFKLTIIMIAGLLIGCAEQEFDAPPAEKLPEGKDITIAEIIHAFDSAGNAIVATSDLYLTAIVVADESSGTFYKELYLQDETGGINVKMNESANHVTKGDKVKVVLKDLVINDYNKLVQIQNVEPAFDIIVLENGQDIEPALVTVTELRTLDYTGQVVRLEGMQFIDAELNTRFAPEQETVNRNIQNCEKEGVLVRVSGYSNFRKDTIRDIAPGNGSIVAIASRFNDDVQLYIRDIREVQFLGERCTVAQVDAVDNLNEDFNTLANYDDPEKLVGWRNYVKAGDRGWQAKDFSGDVYVQASGYNSGLSDMQTWLITPPLDLSAGDRAFGFESSVAYWEHDAGTHPAKIMISTDYDGANVDAATWTELTVTIAGESSSNYTWIKSEEIDLSAYSGVGYIAFSYTGSDTESTTFAVDNFEFGQIGTTSYHDNGGGGEVNPVETLSENFNSLANYGDPGDLDGWTNYLKTGDRGWQAKEFESNVYVQSSGYNSGLDAMETWLITPPLDLSAGDRACGFKSAIAYWEHTSGHPGKVMISTDFDGENIEAATWVELDATLAEQGSANYTWVESGEIDLSAYSGVGYVCFTYEGSDTESTSFVIDDFVFDQAGNTGY